MKLNYVVHSEVGQVRQNNEDSGYASPTMLLVADGMGGAAAGDLASAMTTNLIAERDTSPEDPVEMWHTAISDANDQIGELVAENPELAGMGTTVCGGIFTGSELVVCHIGDSRGYLLRDGDLKQLTVDHSWVQSLVDEGRISVEDAENHPHRNLVLRVVNGDETSEPDVFRLELQVGDRILFCSDGLSGMLSPDELAELAAVEDLSEAREKLSDAANAGGGKDNITFALAEVSEHSPDLKPTFVGSVTEHPGHPAEHKQAALDPEQARYQPRKPKKWRWLRTMAVGLLVIVLLIGAGFGVWRYTMTQYYVGPNLTKVGIYQGVPDRIGGLQLSKLVEESEVQIADLPKFYQLELQDTIRAKDLNAARDTIDELKALATKCREKRAKQPPGTVDEEC